jgi:hypothetical protein
MTAGGYPPWNSPPDRPPQGGNRYGDDTGERLRAALAARSAQIGPEPAHAERYGGPADTPSGYGPPTSPPPSWRGEWSGPQTGSAYTRAESPGGGGGGGRAGLLPRWVKAVLAAAIVLSAVLGVVLGLHSSNGTSANAKLPPARDTSYGEDRARVAITSFVRQGKFVTLELELTNLAPLGTSSSWSVNNAFAESSGYDLSGIRLLDPTAGTSIRPAEDGAGDCICTNTISLTIAAGSSTRVSAQFPAPVATVKKLNIDIPGAGSFRDVPLN